MYGFSKQGVLGVDDLLYSAYFERQISRGIEFTRGWRWLCISRIVYLTKESNLQPAVYKPSHGEIAQVFADASRIAYQHMKDRGSVYVAGAEHEWEIAQTDGPISGGKGLQLDGVFST